MENLNTQSKHKKLADQKNKNKKLVNCQKNIQVELPQCQTNHSTTNLGFERVRAMVPFENCQNLGQNLPAMQCDI